eukprot:scaffold147296_cov33-Tisochrysis_lutea.AAC.1
MPAYMHQECACQCTSQGTCTTSVCVPVHRHQSCACLCTGACLCAACVACPCAGMGMQAWDAGAAWMPVSHAYVQAWVCRPGGQILPGCLCSDSQAPHVHDGRGTLATLSSSAVQPL